MKSANPDCFDVVPRMRLVLDLLAKETQISEMKSKIQSQINDKVDEHQQNSSCMNISK